MNEVKMEPDIDFLEVKLEPEGEVKEEPDIDYLEIKVEPLGEVNEEPNIDFSKVKLEPVGEVKEEPLDHAHFVLREPKFDFSKEGTADFTQPWFELPEPPIESPRPKAKANPRRAPRSYRPLSASEVMEFEKIKEMQREMHGRILRNVPRRSPIRKCTVCSVIPTHDKTMIYQAADKKLFIMIGMVLSGKVPVELAQFHISSHRIHVCNEHVTDALLEIFKVLNIRNINEMHLCSMDNIQNLMHVVNQLSPQMLFVNFLKFVRETVGKMEVLYEQLKDYKKKNPSAAVSVEGQNCLLCNGIGNHVAIDSKNSTLVLMVGLILGGSIAVKHALWITSKPIIYTCKEHLSKAIQAIFKVLEIRHIDEMHSKDNREKLMTTVSSLSSDISFAEFYEYLSDFAQMLNNV